MRAAEGELALTQKALMRNPKSYSAWHHRRWVVRRRLTSLEAEVKLVEALLDADDRNFHGWLYRMFLADVRGGGRECQVWAGALGFALPAGSPAQSALVPMWECRRHHLASRTGLCIKNK